MPQKKQILLLIIALLWLSIAFAQDPQPAWRNYNTDHGLPSSEVYVAMQDSKGYMWFGTDNGVSRFDGYEFRNYGTTDGLQDNVVFDLQEDDQGRIWMMTMTGNAYYYKQDSIFPFEYNDTIQSFKEKYGFRMGVHLYFDDKDSSLYVTLMNLGILQIKADGAYHLYRSENPDALVVLELKEKLLYAFSFFGPWLREIYNRQLQENKLCAPIEFHGNTINTLILEGCVISSTANEGKIKKFRNGSYMINYNYEFGLIKNQKAQWIRAVTTPIKNVFEDQNGAIFLCQAKGFGASKFDNLEMLEKGLSQIYLPGISAVNMAQDKVNGYWFTTTDKGIYYAPGLQFQIYDETSGLSNAYISSFEEKDDSTIFVGLWDEDIFELNTRTHHLQKLKYKGFNESGNIDLFYDEKTNFLWAGDFLSYFNGKSWKQIEYVDSFTYIVQPYFRVQKFINSKAENQLWVSSWKNIGKLDLTSKSFQRLLYDSNNLNYRIFSGFEDINGELWLGRANGLWRLQGDTTPVRPEIMHPSFYNRIEAIHQLRDSTFVLGTKGKGILLWKGDQFTEITTTDGLTSNMIENIYVDEKGVIWVGTLMGLNRVIRQPDNTFSIEKITLQHGLPSNEINKVEVINDEVWVATTKGLVRFPYEHQLSLVSDPPFFEKVLINDEAIDWENTKLTFSHQQNNISLQFLTINYRQNGQIPYRYQLAPTQKNWKETKNREISFPALDNGAYHFEVQSQNEDGIWSDSTSYDFKIWPPWWETWWAISLAILAAASAGFGLYKNRTNQLKKEIKLQQEMAEVERQVLRSQMNPHFIFNALNAIQGYTAQGDKLAANRFLSRFSKLIRTALQHSRVTKVPLEDDLSSLKNYLELEQLRFQDSFDFQIKVADNIDKTEVTIPSMLIQPFVENAIVHGLANLERKGKIDIDFKQKNDSLFITITDNGIGIEASKKQKAGIASSHKSVGMTITKRRLEMLSGNSETGNIEVQELKDENGKVVGTKVTLQIPLEE
jgi:ligand-binding sensor domain-containing protein/signal transduction histidine kinase